MVARESAVVASVKPPSNHRILSQFEKRLLRHQVAILQPEQINHAKRAVDCPILALHHPMSPFLNFDNLLLKTPFLDLIISNISFQLVQRNVPRKTSIKLP
ncbi:MAG: hypothetical protein M2R45_01699 [Verrucomicrobia subdivision 3 bacterium]|nr:hypothetical protein [Limisphaerales bacterium]MCS1413438.1 hypothetical protein [Limisphaerales bacterium]